MWVGWGWWWGGGDGGNGGRREVWKRGGGGCVGTQSVVVFPEMCVVVVKWLVPVPYTYVVLYHSIILQVYLDIKLFLYVQ